MSVKLRMTLWITLMVLLLAAMVLVFVFVINANTVTDDPAGRLVKVVMKNADRLEFDHGRFEWDDGDAYRLPSMPRTGSCSAARYQTASIPPPCRLRKTSCAALR